MKFLSIILGCCICLLACTKRSSPVEPLNNTVDTTMANGVYRGNFINGPYGGVRGTASIYRTGEAYVLALKDMMITNGPDLHVYVSREILPVNFIDLGRLQSIAGNQVYTIPGNPDLSQYKYALIHCQRFNHLFGSAELQ